MARTLERYEEIERSLIKRFRKELWTPLIAGVKRYAMIREGGRVSVPFTGRAASLLLAKLMQELERHSTVPFTSVFFEPAGTDPRAAALAEELRVPLSAPEAAESCPVTALPTLMDDAWEETLAGMLCRGRIASVLPRERRDGREIIRPLYCVAREDLERWIRSCGLTPVPEPPAPPEIRWVAETVRAMKPDNPDIEKNLVNSLHNVWPGTFPPGAAEGGRNP